jgi:Conjugative transposon protein TcpC
MSVDSTRVRAATQSRGGGEPAGGDAIQVEDVELGDHEVDVVEIDDIDLDTGDYDEYEVYDNVDGGGDDHVHDDGPARPTLSRQHIVGSVLLARIAKAALWLMIMAAVFMAAVALVGVASQAGQPEATPIRTDEVAPGDAVLVGGFAQMAVRRYLGEAGEDTEEVLESILDGDIPDLRGVTPAGFYVVDAVTIDVDEIGDGYWSATVAADLMAAVEERYQPVGVRYYNVGVITDGEGGPVLADLPSQVPAPTNVTSPGLETGLLETPDSESAQIAAVREFLGALLLGQGSIQRYTAPGTTIASITPAPFASLEIDGASVVDPEAERTLVRVAVLAVDEHDLAQRLHYTVDLRLRDGRWEVVELFAAPPLAEDETPDEAPAPEEADEQAAPAEEVSPQ